MNKEGENMIGIEIAVKHEGNLQALRLRHALEDVITLIDDEDDRHPTLQPSTLRDIWLIEKQFEIAIDNYSDDTDGITFKPVTMQSSVVDYVIAIQLHNAIRDIIDWLHWENDNEQWRLQPSTIRSMNIIRECLEQAVAAGPDDH